MDTDNRDRGLVAEPEPTGGTDDERVDEPGGRRYAEAHEYAMGLFGLDVEFDGEWSAERSAEAIYEYMRDRGEPVTMSRTAVSLGAASLALGDDRGESGDEALAGAWWRCGDDGEGWITDEADVEIAAEYLYAAAHEEN